MRSTRLRQWQLGPDNVQQSEPLSERSLPSIARLQHTLVRRIEWATLRGCTIGVASDCTHVSLRKGCYSHSCPVAMATDTTGHNCTYTSAVENVDQCVQTARHRERRAKTRECHAYAYGDQRAGHYAGSAADEPIDGDVILNTLPRNNH